MYFKGANILHMIRTITNDDSLWRDVLRGLNKDFYHQTVTTEMVENYISKKINVDLDPLFDQYLRTKQIPIFEYKIDKKKLSYRFNSCNRNFTIPLKINIDNKEHWITPTDSWQTLPVSKKTKYIEVSKDFYIKTRKK